MSFFKKKKTGPHPPAIREELTADIPEASPPGIPVDINEEEFTELFDLCRPFTMTSPERLYSLYKAMNYIISNNIEGDFIECGVWKGGSALMIARILAQKNITDRKVILYDTFEGMPPPTEEDKDFSGEAAAGLLAASSIEVQNSVWCYSSFDEVKQNMSLAGLPPENIILVKGKVEETIPANLPATKLALLRLDTDWYESTKHELLHLYPLLTKNGILIIDDYGHWAGCRKAVDEYISQNNLTLLLNRIDNTGRIGIKN